MYYGSHLNDTPCTPDLSSLNDQKPQNVKSCVINSVHITLGKQIINDLNCKINNVLAEALHFNTRTLTVLFQFHCMNVYKCQIWSYDITYANIISHGKSLSKKSIMELVINYYISLMTVHLVS